MGRRTASNLGAMPAHPGRTSVPGAPFGRVLTAMVTPFTADGGAGPRRRPRLATYLVDAGQRRPGGQRHHRGVAHDHRRREGRGCCGPSLEAVGDRAYVVAGVGTNDTAHTIELAAGRPRRPARTALLVVTPYYNKPPQAGLLAHFTAVADATGLPVMLYDIPGRTGVADRDRDAVRLAEHPRIVAVKDAKGDLLAGIAGAGRAPTSRYYSGDDVLNLPLLAVGAAGFVERRRPPGRRPATPRMIDAYLAGDVATAQEITDGLLPVSPRAS